MKSMKIDFKKAALFFGIAVAAAAIDLFFKAFSRAFGKIDVIPGFFSLDPIINYGAAFSLLQGQKWLFIALSIVVILVSLYYYPKLKSYSVIAVSLIVGGTLGNLIDRLAHSGVWDFISFSFWPSFNIADSCLTIGAFMLAYYLLKHEAKANKN